MEVVALVKTVEKSTKCAFSHLKAKKLLFNFLGKHCIYLFSEMANRNIFVRDFRLVIKIVKPCNEIISNSLAVMKLLPLHSD